MAGSQMNITMKQYELTWFLPCKNIKQAALRLNGQLVIAFIVTPKLVLLYVQYKQTMPLKQR